MSHSFIIKFSSSVRLMSQGGPSCIIVAFESILSGMCDQFQSWCYFSGVLLESLEMESFKAFACGVVVLVLCNPLTMVILGGIWGVGVLRGLASLESRFDRELLHFCRHVKAEGVTGQRAWTSFQNRCFWS